MDWNGDGKNGSYGDQSKSPTNNEDNELLFLTSRSLKKPRRAPRNLKRNLQHGERGALKPPTPDQDRFQEINIQSQNFMKNIRDQHSFVGENRFRGDTNDPIPSLKNENVTRYGKLENTSQGSGAGETKMEKQQNRPEQNADSPENNVGLEPATVLPENERRHNNRDSFEHKDELTRRILSQSERERLESGQKMVRRPKSRGQEEQIPKFRDQSVSVNLDDLSPLSFLKESQVHRANGKRDANTKDLPDGHHSDYQDEVDQATFSNNDLSTSRHFSSKLSHDVSLPSLEESIYSTNVQKYPRASVDTTESHETVRKSKVGLEKLTPMGSRKGTSYIQVEVPKNGNKERVKKGKLVTFYKNGDAIFKGYRTVVAGYYFKSFETLLNWLNEKVPLKSGPVQHVLVLPSGIPVTTLDEFVGGGKYVVSTNARLQRANYGEGKTWVIGQHSGSKVGRSEKDLQNYTFHSRLGGVPKRAQKPRILNVMSTMSHVPIKMYLNERTQLRYEEFLRDIEGAGLQLDNPPLEALYTASPRHRKVNGFSHLKRDLKEVNDFIACGENEYPVDLIVPTTPIQTYDHPATQGSHASCSSVYEDGSPAPIGSPMISHLEGQHHPNRSVNKHGSNSENSHKSEETAEGQLQSPSGSIPYSPCESKSESQITNRKYQDIEKRGSSEWGDQGNKAAESVVVNINGEPKEFPIPRFAEVRPESRLPDKDLQLEWAYGYRGWDTLNNLLVLEDGSLVYFTGAIVVILDRTRQMQKHYMEHSEDITCMSMHPISKNIIATGQLAGVDEKGAAHIRVWDVATEHLKTLVIVGEGLVEASVCALDFTFNENIDDGELLMAIDESEIHTVFIWKWKLNQLIGKTSNTRNNVVWGRFHPSDPTTLVTCGGKHLYVWKVMHRNDSCKILRDIKSGVVSAQTPHFVTSLVFTTGGDIISGDSAGRLTVWRRKDSNSPYAIDGNIPEIFRQGHKHSIFALYIKSDGTILSAADKCVRAWQDYHLEKEINLDTLAGSIRTLVPDSISGLDGMMYLGTSSNEILEGTFNTMFDVIVKGHFDELWGLSPVLAEPAFITAGYDCSVIKWDADVHKLEWFKRLEKPCSSVHVDNRKRNIAVGSTEGCLTILCIDTGNHINSIQVAKESIDAIAFSPDCSYLALGCQDSHIYLYRIKEDGTMFEKHGILTREDSSPVCQIDWSENSLFLRSVSGTNLCLWSAPELREVNQNVMVDVEWATRTATMGYLVSGAWTAPVGTHYGIQCMDACTDKDLLIVGDDQGFLSVYQYPCITEKAQARFHRSHSGSVTSVRFLNGYSRLVSIGGIEGAIYQWKVVDAEDTEDDRIKRSLAKYHAD